MNAKRLVLAALLAAGVGSAANAAPIVGSIAVVGGSVTVDISPITSGPPGTTFTANPLVYSGSASGDFAPIPVFAVADPAPVAISANVGAAVSFSGIYGSFMGTVTSVAQDIQANQRTVSIFVVTGTFTPGAALLAIDPTLTANDAQLTVSGTETVAVGGGGFQSLSLSGTLAAGVAVPAPAALAVFGLGLIGLGLVARRRA